MKARLIDFTWHPIALHTKNFHSFARTMNLELNQTPIPNDPSNWTQGKNTIKKTQPTATIHSSQWTERARPISPQHGTSAEMKECPTQSVTHHRHYSFSAAIIHSAATHLCGNNGVHHGGGPEGGKGAQVAPSPRYMVNIDSVPRPANLCASKQFRV